MSEKVTEKVFKETLTEQEQQDIGALKFLIDKKKQEKLAHDKAGRERSNQHWNEQMALQVELDGLQAQVDGIQMKDKVVSP